MEVIDVRIREHRIVARFKEETYTLSVYDHVVLDIDGDKELGRVERATYTWEDELPPESGAYVVRPAEDADLFTYEENRAKEKEAYQTAAQCIKEREMEMDLVSAEQTLDGRKIRFYFTAEGRIDFRELVKDLAGRLKARIDMRQIGVRDRSKKTGGFGPCGEQLCCSRFLTRFAPITIKMAKVQNLALNPSKLSGQCGRLKCCLAYEEQDYQVYRREFPRHNARVNTPEGEGKVRDMNFLRRTVTVAYEDAPLRTWNVDEISLANS